MAERNEPDIPSLTIGRGWAIYVGPVESGKLHRHQAAQLAWSTRALLLEGTCGVIEAAGHFVAARVPHRLVAAEPVRMVFLDPTMLGAARPRSQPTTVAALTALQADLLEHELDQWLRGRASSRPHRPSHRFAEDPRWVAALQWLEQGLDGPVRLEDAAEVVGLSPSRFMHWFSKASGLSFRAYVRWLRLQRAVRTLSDGSTLAEAARLAGFADSAHLTRTFVATFGVLPVPLRGVQIVCDDDAKPPVTPDGLALVDPV